MAERVIEGMELRYIPIDILKVRCCQRDVTRARRGRNLFQLLVFLNLGAQATKIGIILAKLSKKTKEESLKKACLGCIKAW